MFSLTFCGRILLQLVFSICFVAILLSSTQGAEKIIVIGDSLSKEYELEFPLLNPSNPAAWDERNWLELLSEHRADYVDIGKQAVWPDSRLLGHEYNYAFPGSTTSEWEDILTSTIFTHPEFLTSRLSLNQNLKDVADRVVIFLGGNDLKNNYRTYATGTDPTDFINGLVSNVEIIVNYVRDQNTNVPIVLVNIPDVGATPIVVETYPSTIERQRVTAITKEVNLCLSQLAKAKRIGYADIEQITDRIINETRFILGGVRFLTSIDPNPLSNDPEYLFSPDAFHPNTAMHFLIANEINRAFEIAYPTLPAIPQFSTEELLTILGIPPDVSRDQWAEAYGLNGFAEDDDSDGDGAALLEEFVFDMDPNVADSEQRAQGYWTDDQMGLRYRLRLSNSTHFMVTPEFSSDLSNWKPVPTEQTTVEKGLRHTWIAPQNSNVFLQLRIQGL